ncbi:MAG: hypothetical protein IKC11_05730 [Clostridia bacterium]|nr:hypothetical protein [Clostridia bacterium]
MKKVLIGILVVLGIIIGGGAIAYHTSPTFKDWTDKNILKYEQVVDKDDESSDDTTGDDTTGDEVPGDNTTGDEVPGDDTTGDETTDA